MKHLEYVAAAAMLIFAVAAVFGTSDLLYWDDTAPGSRLVPLWTAGVSALLALLLIVEARQREPDVAVDWPDRAGAIRVILTIIAIWGFVLAVPWLGFVLGTALFVLAMLIGIARRRLVPSLLATVLTAGMVQVVFVSGLKVALPKGVLGF